MQRINDNPIQSNKAINTCITMNHLWHIDVHFELES